MIELKLGEVINAQQALTRILNEPLPVKASYRLSKIVKKVSDEMVDFNAKRSEMFKKYGEAVPESKTGEMRIKKENMETFVKEMNELLDLQVKIDFDPITFEDLGVKAELTAVDLVLLEKFIVEKK